jgi:hypothetical protein
MDLAGHLWRVSEKIDGVRRIFYKNKTGIVYSFSRTFKPDPWVEHICQFFTNPKFMCDTYYDCELVDRRSYFERTESFEMRTVTSGKAAQEFDDNKRDLMAICFDYYQPDVMTNTLERTKNLKIIFNYFALEDPVILVPIYGNVYGEHIVMITKLADKIIAMGGEGLMLQDCDLPYIQGKSKHLIKVKRREDFIGTIKELEMAMKGTKIEGGVRSVICEVDGCTSLVRVGSGFNEIERYFMAENKKRMVGEKIEIEAFGRSRDAKGQSSLSMPIFKRFCTEGLINDGID